ncbi:sugar phosphate isomerase/epimerase family protein [Acerihabitans arboris]|uniref:Sugar phosphate isomerase/epimerase n=1 Tax=Acerihabitans arboris TaxID=2691583 RepID=A0A845SQ24_9GAMM|nr:sugar phosphate isomerase/epimerase [Acerihabitans arboris]NDL64691.1 sugar phosphate isomerase/epimerase [Acerihabitans arboris]
MKHEVFVVTAAYGNDNVLAMGGQGELLPIIAQAGACGVEIRRELLTETELTRLPELARAIAGLGLRGIYSAPEALFAPDGAPNPLLPQLFAEARQLGAERLKLSLGHYSPTADIDSLNALLAAQPVRLMVENDQTECGALAPISAFLRRARDARLPVGMTFDMGNWRWVDEDPQAAAAALSAFVSYIHVKVAAPADKGWRAAPPENDAQDWRRLLAGLPDDAPRAIEFPLEGDDLAAITRRYVALLRMP